MKARSDENYPSYYYNAAVDKKPDNIQTFLNKRRPQISERIPIKQEQSAMLKDITNITSNQEKTKLNMTFYKQKEVLS